MCIYIAIQTVFFKIVYLLYILLYNNMLRLKSNKPFLKITATWCVEFMSPFICSPTESNMATSTQKLQISHFVRKKERDLCVALVTLFQAQITGKNHVVT